MRDVYTKAQLRFLRKGYASMKVQDLTVAFNKKFATAKSETAIKSAITNHRITCGRTHSQRLMPCRLYTKEQQQFLRDNQRGLSRVEIADLYNERFDANMTIQQVKTFFYNRGLSSGLTGYFPKGHTPMNKGTKGLTGRNRTSFKKGDVPPNIKPMYAERITKDGYIEIKVAERNPHTGSPTRYRLKHAYIWEQAHGKIPAGHALLFKDGNKLNCDLDNLMLVSRFELLRLNKHGYKDAPAEIKPSILALSKVEVKVFNLQKEATL